MKFLVLFVALLISSSMSVAAETVFKGSLQLTGVQNCQRQFAGSDYNSVFYSASIAGNENNSSISTVHTWGTFGYHLDVGAFTSNFKQVQGINYGNFLGTFPAFVRITATSPATIGATTNTVILTGQIRNAGQDPGVSGNPCIVTFRGVYFKDQ